MIPYNCVMLSIQNPVINLVGNELERVYSRYIDKEVIKSQGWKSLHETYPHITLIYGLESIGRYSLSYWIKIKNRPEFLGVAKLDSLTIDDPKISYFDSSNGGYVLIIPFLECNEFDKLNSLSKSIAQLPNNWKYGNPYRPHCTISYLTKDAPVDEIAEYLTEKYKDNLKSFQLIDLVFSSELDTVDNFHLMIK